MSEQRESYSDAVGYGFRLGNGDLVIAASWHDFLFGIRLCPGCDSLHIGPFSIAYFGGTHG